MIRSLAIKPNQRLGKYRIERKLGDGGFANVFRAFDTLEAVRVALKVPYDYLLSEEWLAEFRREVRINAQLHHPNILPVKTADLIDGRLVVAYPLGERTLQDRMRSRMSLLSAIEYIDQLLEAAAFAHPTGRARHGPTRRPSEQRRHRTASHRFSTTRRLQASYPCERKPAQS